MPARSREFGFICPDFSLSLSANGFLLPRSRRELLGSSLIVGANTRHLTGAYVWEIHHNGAEFWKLPVVVAWARHHSHPEPFLAIRASQPRLVRQQLKALAGADVELSFSPRPAGS